ncbi:MAG: phytanoyl-CoA dioxygenase family protein [Candidatus Latescibacterota bacterium]|nr:phytanoyl-CoA dioxygenase family protein [Candidatus Latescibacterota bacterium]
MNDYMLNSEQMRNYNEHGFLMLPSFFTGEEMQQVLEIARADRALMNDSNDRLDRSGKVSRLSLRYDLQPSIYSAYARHRAIVEPMQQLIGEEVFHYHHKMMLKEPRIGGAWEWHQDYGYWYNNFLRPAMASCMIFVDRATKENGCLQVLRGSHKLGRLDHGKAGDQTGADLQRVEIVRNDLETVYCEMEPGSLLFFHSNLLHRSDANESEESRWALICCYSASTNPTFRFDAESGHYQRLDLMDKKDVEMAALAHSRQLNLTP